MHIEAVPTLNVHFKRRPHMKLKTYNNRKVYCIKYILYRVFNQQTMLRKKMAVFLVVPPSTLVKVYQRFRCP